MEKDLRDKIIAHRAKGFSEYDHSPSAFREACKSGVKYVEIDVRVSEDGKFYALHDPETGEDIDRSLRVADTSSEELEEARYKNGEVLLSLEKAIDIFKEEGSEGQKLCIDIKDFGYEKELLEQVRGSGVEDDTIFITWTPQTVMALYSRSKDIPIFLSYINLLKHSTSHELFRPLLDRLFISKSPYLLMGRDQYNRDLREYSRGYKHIYFAGRLPEPLEEAVRESGGGICIPKRLLCQEVKDYCRDAGLDLWVFTAESEQEFQELAEDPGVDAVFCDRAKDMLG